MPGLPAASVEEGSITPILTDGVQTGWNWLVRNSTSNEVMQSRATSATVAQLIAGTVSWPNAAVMPTVGTYALAQPNQLTAPSGVIMFMSRSTAAYPPELATGIPVLCASSNGGSSWTIQNLENDLVNPNGSAYRFNYGVLLSVPNQPNLVLAIYSVTLNESSSLSQIRFRYVTIGAGATPMGGIGAPSVFARTLLAQQGQIGQLVIPNGQTSTPPTGLNPSFYIRKSFGTFAAPTTGSPGLFTSPAPVFDQADMRTDVGVVWQNMRSIGLVDSATAGPTFTPGTLYLFKMTPLIGIFYQDFYLHTGATAGSGVTDIYFGLYRNALTLISGSTAITSAPANSALRFPLASAITSGLGQIYGGFLFVGTTAPSLYGQSIPQELSNHTPIYLSTSSTSQTSLPSTAAAQTAIGGVVPLVEFSTS